MPLPTAPCRACNGAGVVDLHIFGRPTALLAPQTRCAACRGTGEGRGYVEPPPASRAPHAPPLTFSTLMRELRAAADADRANRLAPRGSK
jgi:hypothetical protein